MTKNQQQKHPGFDLFRGSKICSKQKTIWRPRSLRPWRRSGTTSIARPSHMKWSTRRGDGSERSKRWMKIWDKIRRPQGLWTSFLTDWFGRWWDGLWEICSSASLGKTRLLISRSHQDLQETLDTRKFIINLLVGEYCGLFVSKLVLIPS